MKVKTKEEIKAMSQKFSQELAALGFCKGYDQAQKDMIESASSGFNEWWETLPHNESYMTGFIHKSDALLIWHAAVSSKSANSAL